MASASETNVSEEIISAKEEIDLDAAEMALHAKQNLEREELELEIQAIKSKIPKINILTHMQKITEMEAEMEKRHVQELLDLQEMRERQNELYKIQKARLRERNLLNRFRRNYKYSDYYSPRAFEMRAIKEKLTKCGLTLYNIPGNYDCLYNAICHGLLQAGLGIHSVEELRAETANYIQMHKATFIECMKDSQAGDSLNNAEFENYCQNIRKSAAVGGQIELKALSKILRVSIVVIQDDGPNLKHGVAEFEHPKFIITFHRYLYNDREHYNSTMPLVEGTNAAE